MQKVCEKTQIILDDDFVRHKIRTFLFRKAKGQHICHVRVAIAYQKSGYIKVCEFDMESRYYDVIVDAIKRNKEDLDVAVLAVQNLPKLNMKIQQRWGAYV